jgi:hypothetical protein
LDESSADAPFFAALLELFAFLSELPELPPFLAIRDANSQVKVRARGSCSRKLSSHGGTATALIVFSVCQ